MLVKGRMVDPINTILSPYVILPDLVAVRRSNRAFLVYIWDPNYLGKLGPRPLGWAVVMLFSPT